MTMENTKIISGALLCAVCFGMACYSVDKAQAWVNKKKSEIAVDVIDQRVLKSKIVFDPVNNAVKFGADLTNKELQEALLICQKSEADMEMKINQIADVLANN